MSAANKIITSRKLLLELLMSDISKHSLNKSGKELKITLSNGILLYIVYNNHSQYSYTIQYSSSKLDRKRFDNFDNRWDVTSKPHHYHMKGSIHVEESRMIGDPNADMQIFADFIFS